MSAQVTEAHIARARASGYTTDKVVQMAAQFIANNEASKAERDQIRADRDYNHECINRLASATGTLGEKSERVVEVALSTIDRAERAEAELVAERARLDAMVANCWVVHSEVGGSFSVFSNTCGDCIATAQTYRAAIDAAMKEETK